MLPIIGIIIFVFLHLASARNVSLSKNYQFPNQNLVLADPSFDNKTLFYALYTQSSKHCTIMQEINPFTNYSVTKQCKFVIKVDAVQLIAGFGIEKAVIITQEVTPKSLKLKAMTVHMASCKTVDAELVEVPLNWTNRKMYRDYIDVVVTESGFEVIIKGLSHLCTKPNAKIYCGVSFDAEGNKIEGPLIWPKMAYNEIDIISPVMVDASGQGYFFINRDSSLLAFQLNRKGGPKFVKLWYTPIQYSNLWREGYSVANEVDGMCYTINSTIGCWQTDREGELKINMEFEFDPTFKANMKQCNTTKPSEIQKITTQMTKLPDSTAQDTTTQSTTIQLTTGQESTITGTATQETVSTDNITGDIIVNETVIHENTDDDTMQPITVKGLTVEDVTTQDAITQNATAKNDITQDGTIAENTIQDNVTLQESTTESNAVQENITELDVMIPNNSSRETAIETDPVQNNTSENSATQESATQETIIIDNTTLDSASEDNVILKNTLQDITVRGLATEAHTTPDSAVHANTTEHPMSEITVQDVSLQDITVQGIAVQDRTTPKSLALKSLSQVKLTAGEHKVWNMFIHNLRNGGLIIFIILCPNRDCSGFDDRYYLIKINSSGKRVGQLQMKIKSKCYPKNGEVCGKVFENDVGQYCAVRLCKSKLNEEAQLETLVNCYCNSDFK